MSTDLSKTNEGGRLIEVEEDDAKLFGELASSGKWLPRLQLFGSNSEPVKSGKFPMAHYGLVMAKEDILDVGDTVVCLPVSWRAKAMSVADGEIINVYDVKDPEFARIRELSDVKDSGCMAGAEFLLWLPETKKFCTFFMASKTMRKEAPALRDRLGMPTTLRVTYIKTKKYSWHGPVVSQCSTPFDLPNDEDLESETQRFKNPPKSEVETVDSETTGGGRAR